MFSSKKKSKITFINENTDIDLLAEKRKHLILGGNFVFVTMKPDINPGDDYVLISKKYTSILPWRNKNRLYIWVSKTILEAQKKYHSKIYSLHDYYLRIGLTKYKKTILLGGGESSSELNLEIFEFDRGELKTVVEYLLPPSTSNRCISELESKIKNKIGNGAKVVWCPPLPINENIKNMLDKYNIQHAGTKSFKLPATKIAYKQKRSADKLIFFMMLASVVAFATPVWYGWNHYKDALHTWQQELKGYESLYSEGESRLNILENQKYYLSKRQDKIGDTESLFTILNAISNIKDVELDHIKYDLPKNNNKVKYIIRVTSNAKKDSDIVEHARELMEKIVQYVGGDLSLMQFSEKNNKNEEIVYKYTMDGETYT